jgi:hypothetical protein
MLAGRKRRYDSHEEDKDVLRRDAGQARKVRGQGTDWPGTNLF